jgi:hypothetical protein
MLLLEETEWQKRLLIANKVANCLLKNIEEQTEWRIVFFDSPFFLSLFCWRTILVASL